jgi:hypothetical protein
MNHRFFAAVALGAALAFPALAQPGERCCSGMRMGPDNTAGWSMMTPKERDEHHAKMAEMKSTEQCKSYMTEHHAKMAERAKERGVKLGEPRHSMCMPMKEGAPKEGANVKP